MDACEVGRLLAVAPQFIALWRAIVIIFFCRPRPPPPLIPFFCALFPRALTSRVAALAHLSAVGQAPLCKVCSHHHHQVPRLPLALHECGTEALSP